MKRKILLDLSVPRPPASAFPTASQDKKDIPHLTLDSHNGSVTGEVWLLRAAKPESARERAHLHFHSHNGSVKALVVRKLPPSMARVAWKLICSLAAHPPVDGRASPVPQHRS